MKKLIIAAVVVVALVGGAVAALPLAERYFAGNIKASIDSDKTLSVGSVEVGLLDRQVTFHDLQSKLGVSIKDWKASGLSWPLGEILHGRTPLTGYRLGDPLKADRIEASDVKTTAANGITWSFGSVVLEGVDLERFDADIPPGPFQTGALTARVLKSLSLRRFEERNVIYSMPFTGDTVGFQSLAGGNVDHGKIGTVTLAGMEATPKAGVEPAFVMGTLKSEGLDLRRILTAMSEPSWRPGMPLGRLGIDKMSASDFGGEAMKRYGIALGSISIEVTHQGEVASSSTKINGFVMTPPSGSLEGLRARMVMMAMGLQQLKLDLECNGREDRAKNEVVMDRCALTGDELGELNITGKLVNADEAFWRAMDGGNAFAIYASKAGLGEAKIALADKGLLDKGLRALGAVSGAAPATARTNMASEIRRYQPPNVLITDDMTKLLDTVARFVEKGGTLTIEARPDPPFGIANIRALQQPGPDLINLLGLSATVSK
jgi:hypothetical protein